MKYRVDICWKGRGYPLRKNSATDYHGWVRIYSRIDIYWRANHRVFMYTWTMLKSGL